MDDPSAVGPEKLSGPFLPRRCHVEGEEHGPGPSPPGWLQDPGQEFIDSPESIKWVHYPLTPLRIIVKIK